MRKQASKPWVIGLMSLPSLLLAGAAHGFVAPSPSAESFTAGNIRVGIRTLRPQLIEGAAESFSPLADSSNVVVKRDARTGAPRLITGHLLYVDAIGSQAEEAAYVALAQRYIAAHGRELGITFSDLRLHESATVIAPDVQLISFHVLRGGLRVQDASVDFRFKGGKLVQVVNRSYSEAHLDGDAVQGDLAASVAAALSVESLAPAGDAYRVVAAGDGYKLVRVSEFNTLTTQHKLFIVQVESASGKVFEVRPTEFLIDGSASGDVYARTYYKEDTIVQGYRDLDINYGGGKVTTDPSGAFTNVPDGSSPVVEGFAGKRVKVVPETGDLVKLASSQEAAGWSLSFKRAQAEDTSADTAMAQSMTYYHLNKEIQHAKQFITNPWLDQQLTANVNLAQSCNAYWNGVSVNLFSAGEGCANTALISDVFYHEWGHGLHANTSGIEDGAYSEGYSDTCALLMTHSHVVGPGFRTADGGPVRDMAQLKVYPDDANTEIHSEGIIIGGAFWDLFKSFKGTYGEDAAADKLSNLVLKVISTTHHYTDVYDALLVLDNTTGNLADGSPNFCAINAAFTRHGLAKADTDRCSGAAKRVKG